MRKIAVRVLALASLSVPYAAAAQVDDGMRFEQGRQIYEAQCARCHRPGGEGAPPAFPALAGNERLSDADFVLRTIRGGAGNMPPFPALTAAETAAVASYVRTAWTNGFGPVAADAVAAGPDAATADVAAASIADGVFTAAQAQRGRDVYAGACALCHGRRLNGAAEDPDMRSTPPLARARFLREWEGRTLAALLAYTRATMPEDNPGSLDAGEYVDVIAYMLSVSGMPAGDAELPVAADRLARIVVQRRQ